jgi:hypothetical protein
VILRAKLMLVHIAQTDSAAVVSSRARRAPGDSTPDSGVTGRVHVACR